MRVVIIEDEPLAAQKLKQLLLSLEPTIEVLAILTSIAAGRAFFKENTKIDLAFCDIHLEDGLSFSLLQDLAIWFPIVFTTAYDRYAIKAFEYHSIDYLLKPLQKKDVARALLKLNKLETDEFRPFEALQSSYTAKHESYKERFTVKFGDKIRLIPIEEISCFYSKNKGSFLYTTSGKSYFLEQSLEHIYSLVDPKIFFKVNRKHLVKVHAIESVIQFSNSRQKVILKTPLDEDIIVAREKVKDFKDWMEG